MSHQNEEAGGKLVERQVVHPIEVDGKSYKRNSLVKLTPHLAEIFKSRLCDPGSLTKAGRKSKLEVELSEAQSKIEELTAQNHALHAENVKLKERFQGS